MGGGGPGGGLGLERSTSSSFFAASKARLLRASSCNCLTSPSLKAKRSRMGTPACDEIIRCGVRRRTLSRGDVLGSLSSSETSVLTYSHFGICRSSPNRMEETPAQGTPSGVLHLNASTHSFSGRCMITIIVGIVPLISVDLPPARVPSRLRLI